MNIKKLESLVKDHLVLKGENLYITKDGDPSDLGLHAIDHGDSLEAIEIESYARANGLLKNGETVEEWY